MPKRKSHKEAIKQYFEKLERGYIRSPLWQVINASDLPPKIKSVRSGELKITIYLPPSLALEKSPNKRKREDDGKACKKAKRK